MKSSLPKMPFVNPCHFVSISIPIEQAVKTFDCTINPFPSVTGICMISPTGLPVSPIEQPSSFATKSFTKND